MKRFNSLLCALLLTLSISSAAFAGDISTGKAGDISTGRAISRTLTATTSIFSNVTGIIMYLL